MLFKGFKQVLEKDDIEFENGFLYFVRTNDSKTDGYLHLNGKNYGTGESFLEKIYPVGYIYMSILDTNPSDLFGFGVWERIKDTFLLGASNTYQAGSMGGETKHKLTIDELPSHSHTAHGIGIATTAVETNLALRSVDLTEHHSGEILMRTANTGNGSAHNNMPPYLAVYMWKRIQ